MGVYSNFIMDLLSKDNYKARKENEQLKDIIEKFISRKYSKKKFILEYHALIDKNKKSG